MAYSHLKVLDIVQDTDGQGKPRIRLSVQEVMPRSLFVNLKNCPADKINQLRGLIGGTAMIPIREGMMEGSTFFSLLVNDEILPMQPPQPVATSGVAFVDSGSFGLKPEEKPAEPVNSFAGAKLVK